MKAQSSQQAATANESDRSNGSELAAPETEASKKGGIEPAKRQAERDWQDSAKESGE